MNGHVGLVGTIEETPRGMKLRDADGMWWRLTGDIDPSPFVSGTVRIVGIVKDGAVIEICYCEMAR